MHSFYNCTPEPSNHYPIQRFMEAILIDNVTAAKRILDAGLDPNSLVLTSRAASTSPVDGRPTLLYEACRHGKMDIVKMLLAAGADPDKPNGFAFEPTSSPFTLAIKQGNTELMSVLLHGSKHVEVKPCEFSSNHLRYGTFWHFHNDSTVMEAIMAARSPFRKEFISPCPGLFDVLHGAAKHQCKKLCTYLLRNCGVERVVDAVLDKAILTQFPFECGDESVRDTLAFLMETHGDILDNEGFRQMFIACGTSGMLELLMGLMYNLYGNNKGWWRHQMTSLSDPSAYGTSFISFMHSNVVDELNSSKKSRFETFMQWGMYSVVRDIPQRRSVLFTLIQSARLKDATMLISLYPDSLQEPWLRTGLKPWSEDQGEEYDQWNTDLEEEELEEYVATLIEKRKKVPSLKVICRSLIFNGLEINPIAKATHLPLPEMLIKYVQCEELFAN